MTAVQDAPPSSDAAAAKPARVEVLIIGAGFAGLGMAINLKRAGRDDFVVIEREDDVGGTWWVNTYPGCQCDVPSHLYSFSFKQNPDWTRTYSGQPEIRDYLLRCADEFGVRRHVRLNTEVTAASWDDEQGRWLVETGGGTYSAHVVVGAMGALSTPKFPDIPGLDSFEGKLMHSAQWDHDHDLTGERVASIGTGASAIQYVPAIQPKVKQLHVFQRTAPWVFPHTDRPTKAWERRLYRAFPALQRLVRGGVYAGREVAVLGFVKEPRLMKIAERMAKRHMEKQIPDDPELRAKVTPGYTIGCKRILPTNNWYPTLTKPNVELVTDPIAEVKPHSVVTKDGAEREVDTIIFGTGFTVTEMPIVKWLRGRDGSTLEEHWKGSMQAHLGTAIDGYPNFFMLAGPNTGLGHSSMVYMIESQIAHVMGALKAMDERGADTVEVRRDVVERYNAGIQKQLEGTVWNTGCSSWYLDDTGRNPTLWPDWTFRFRNRVKDFDPAEYALEQKQGERSMVAA